MRKAKLRAGHQLQVRSFNPNAKLVVVDVCNAAYGNRPGGGSTGGTPVRVTTGDFVNGVFRVARSCKSAELQAMLHLEDELCLVTASSLEVERGVRQLRSLER